MGEREDQFRGVLVEILKNIKEFGSRHAEAMWLTGSLAARLMNRTKSATWPDFKKTLSPGARNKLLRDFEEEGNALYAEGKEVKAYAIQALSASVVASMLLEPDLKEGEVLLDRWIAASLKVFRENPEKGKAA
jgi:hypothetical protein